MLLIDCRWVGVACSGYLPKAVSTFKDGESLVLKTADKEFEGKIGFDQNQWPTKAIEIGTNDASKEDKKYVPSQWLHSIYVGSILVLEGDRCRHG